MSEKATGRWEWHYQPDMDGNDTAEIYITDAEGREILRIDPDMAEVSPAEYVRIARIATAGPDLLAACESNGESGVLAQDGPELLEKVATWLDGSDFAGPLRIKAALERAAIAKARGE